MKTPGQVSAKINTLTSARTGAPVARLKALTSNNRFEVLSWRRVA